MYVYSTETTVPVRNGHTARRAAVKKYTSVKHMIPDFCRWWRWWWGEVGAGESGGGDGGDMLLL